MKIARLDASNDAHNECRALGDGWNFAGNKFPGYEQCTRYGKSEEFRCKVTQAVYECKSMRKENEAKAAAARATKEEAAKAAKEKADREKSEREARKKVEKDRADRERAVKEAAAKAVKDKADRERAEKTAKDKADQLAEKNRPEKIANAIDDGFAKLEKQTGSTPTAKTGSIDDEFAKVETYRTEKERQRVAALKARQERDAATQFCESAFTSQKNCLKDACGYVPGKTVCTEQKRDKSSGCTPSPGSACLFIPRYTCVSTGPNPAYAKWETCTASMENQCAAKDTAARSEDGCVTQRLRAGGRK